MGDAALKAVLYEQFARVGKALANPARLELLDLLAQSERSVEELAEASGMKLSNTSAQLKALSAAGLIVGRRSGVRIFYRLADEQVAVFTEQIKDFARTRVAEAERAVSNYLGDVATLEPVGSEELARLLDDGQVLALDVRPEVEYAAGHIRGAINIPYDRLAARLAELPVTAEIVAYCRGRYCVYAPDAVRLLREHGRTARPLDGGLPEWRRAGLPVESSTAA